MQPCKYYPQTPLTFHHLFERSIFEKDIQVNSRLTSSFLPLFKSLSISGLYLPFIQFSSVAPLCSTLCEPMDCNTPGFPVHHQLPEPAEIHVHRVGDAI